VRVIRLAEAEYGSLDTEKLARVRRLLLDQAEKPNPPYLVVDLSEVHYLGASFIGMLVDTCDRLRRRSRRLVLCGLTPYCSKLILTGKGMIKVAGTRSDSPTLTRSGTSYSGASQARQVPKV
jgi:anti-anti-sigma factor